MDVRSGWMRGVLLALATITATGAATRPATLDFRPATFEANDGRMTAAEVASLKLPENPEGSSRAGKSVTLTIWRFAATGTPVTDPIVILDGGPGGAAIEAARGVYYDIVQRLRAFGDVIVADQRGTGESKPALDCKHAADLPDDELLTIESWLDALKAPAQRCARTWREKKVDLSAYSSIASAADLDAIRAGLGANQLTVWGISYGTQLALTYLEAFPDRVARMVLLGVLPTDGLPGFPKDRDKVLKELGKLARQADPGRYPDTAGALRAILEDLDDNPRDVAVQSNGRAITVRFGKYELQLLTNLLVLGRRELMQRFPRWVEAMQAGDFSEPAATSQFLRHWHTSAMAMAITCTTGENPKRVRKAMKQAARSITGPQPSVADACEPWGIATLPDHPITLSRSNVPALVLAGTMDGTTPFGNARAVTRKLPRSRLVKLVRATHNDLLAPAVLDTIDAYLAGEAVPDTIAFDWAFQ